MKLIELFKIKEIPHPRNACVYFLFKNGELVYIGQTKDLRLRLQAHKNKRKILFDDYRIVPAPWNNLQRANLERLYISKFKPPHNKNGLKPPVTLVVSRVTNPASR